MTKPDIKEIRGIIKSFINAFNGLFMAIRTERNLRIHFVAAFYILYFSRFYNFSKLEYSVIFLLISVVIGAELINTSIERLVDVLVPTYDSIAKHAKDVAAAAVLVVAIFSGLIGLLLFWDIEIFVKILNHFLFYPLRISALFISAILSFIFIFTGRTKKSKINGKIL